MDKSPVADWLHQKWRSREDVIGTRITQQEFADYMKVSPNFIGMVLTGKRKAGFQTVALWAEITGDNLIYDIAGFSDRKPRQASFSEMLSTIPTDRIPAFFASIREIASITSESGIDISFW